MADAEFWDLERGFWLQGEPHFRAHMAQGCIMAFPEPVGALTGSAIVESLQSVPRWKTVDFGKTILSRIGRHGVVLAYRAHAIRDGGPPYRALCSSTYIDTDAGWRLVQHQHTPI